MKKYSATSLEQIQWCQVTQYSQVRKQLFFNGSFYLSQHRQNSELELPVTNNFSNLNCLLITSFKNIHGKNTLFNRKSEKKPLIYTQMISVVNNQYCKWVFSIALIVCLAYVAKSKLSEPNLWKNVVHVVMADAVFGTSLSIHAINVCAGWIRTGYQNKSFVHLSLIWGRSHVVQYRYCETRKHEYET